MQAKKYGQMVDSVGFEYYLNRLETLREKTRHSVQIDLLRLLARNRGEMRLFDMASDYLGNDVTGDDMMDFFETIKEMKASHLIKVLGAEGKASKGVKNLRIKLTEIGKTALEVKIGLPIAIKGE